jgi:hypothetical protein
MGEVMDKLRMGGWEDGVEFICGCGGRSSAFITAVVEGK